MRHRAPIIAAVVAVLLGVGFYFLLWQPKNEELEEVRAETAQLAALCLELQNDLRRLQEIEEREVEFRAAAARLEEYIPTGPTQATAIRQFQTTADAAGITIDSITFSEPVVVEDAPPTGDPDTVLASLTVSMTVEGGYFQVVDFFRRLETDVPRAVLMQNVGMGAGADGFSVLSTNWTGQMFTVIPDPVPLEVQPEADAEDGDVDDQTEGDVDPDADDLDEDAEDGIQARSEEEEQS